MFNFTFDAIGTQWEIETHEPLSSRLEQRILERIRQFDTIYSRFRPDSLVSRIAAAPHGGCFEFPDDSMALFNLYDRLHELTGGALDPLVGRDLELLGYDRMYSLTPASGLVRAEHARRRAAWAKDVRRDGNTLVTRFALVIDVGAAGKGYLVDIVSDESRSRPSFPSPVFPIPSPSKDQSTGQRPTPGSVARSPWPPYSFAWTDTAATNAT